MTKVDAPFLQIEPTTRCNYKCGFCAGRHMKPRSMSLETFENIIDNVYEIKHIQMQGEGEPMLNPNLFVMMRMVRDRFPLAIISMYTNGSILTKKVIDHMISVRVDSLYISLESAVTKTFNRIRGGNLTRVILGIEALMKNPRPLRPEVGLAVTVLKETVQDIVPITRLYKNLGLDGGITIQPLSSMDSYTNIYDDDMNSQLLTREDMDEFHNILQADPEAKAVMEEKPSIPSFHAHLDQANDPDPKPWIDENFGCPWLNKGSYVAVDGTACSCCFIKDISQGFGTFSQENVHLSRKSLQDELRKGIIPDQCKNCAIAQHVADEVS